MADEIAAPTGQIAIREVVSAEDLETIYVIRDRVFVDEQSLTSNARNDPDDRRSIHYLADVDEEPVGTGRLTILGQEAQVAWVAVLPEYRRYGLGSALMDVMIERSEQENASYIILNAQVHARNFYRRLGFHEVGDEFTMARIVHQVMIRNLSDDFTGDVRQFFRQFGST